MLGLLLVLTITISAATSASPEIFPVLTVSAYNYGPGVTSDVRSGSVVTADSNAATISLDCAKTRVDCSLFPQQTLIIGPNIYTMNYGSGGDSEGLQACDTMHAICTEDYSAVGANATSATTVTYPSDQVATLAIVLTAGAELLEGNNPPMTASTPAAMTSGPSGPTGNGGSATSSHSGASKLASMTGGGVCPLVFGVGFGLATGLLAVLL